MIIRKIIGLALLASAAVALSGCVGEAANVVSGTNGAFLMFNGENTPPSFSLTAGTPTVITVSNVPIDGAVATNITVVQNTLGAVTVDNQCPSTLTNPNTCTITLSLPAGYTTPAIDGSLTVNYMAGSKSASANMPVTGGSGGSGDNTPQPTKYTATIPSGGTLTSVNNLYLASSTTNAPLIFGATNLTTDTTVNFVVQANSASSSKLQAGGTLPTLSPSSCTFTATNPQPCTITMNASSAPAGSYSVVPSVGSSNMTALSVTTQASSYVTLPDGTYTSTENSVDSSTCQLSPGSLTYTVSGGQICIGSFGCQTNPQFPIPSGPNPLAGLGYLSNLAWTGSVLTLNWTPSGCPGLISPTVLTKVSNNTATSTSLQNANNQALHTFFHQ